MTRNDKKKLNRARRDAEIVRHAIPKINKGPNLILAHSMAFAMRNNQLKK